MTLRTMTAAVLAALFLALPARAGAQGMAGQGMAGQGIDMPDARQMSGMPLNASELAPGTVTVRVVRGAMTNPLANQKVELTGDVTAAMDTNDTGRAEFTGLKIGAHLKASVIVDGQISSRRSSTSPRPGGSASRWWHSTRRWPGAPRRTASSPRVRRDPASSCSATSRGSSSSSATAG